MRNYTFRAWDDYSKEWLLGYELPNLGGFSLIGETILFGEWNRIVERFIISQKDRKPEHLIIEQFTGVLDNLGNQIYEGDVVKHESTIYPCVIFYKRKIAQFMARELKDKPKVWQINEKKSITVIGNIHDK